MKTSETISKIAMALVKAQKEITFASKDAMNPHLKSKYADLPSVIDAIKVPLNNNGIFYMQSPGLMIDMHLHLTTRLIHDSGEWIEETMSIPMIKQDPQAFGSALTYARRYGLSSITGLYADDDDGYAASNHAKTVASEKPLLANDRFVKALDAVKANTYTPEKLREKHKLTIEQEEKLCALEKELANVPYTPE